MKSRSVSFPIIAALCCIAGCALPQVFKPLNLYDINNGNTIELYFNPTSAEHGTITSASTSGENFHGECMFSAEHGYPRPDWSNRGEAQALNTTPKDFAEAYGLPKDSQVKPVGTGIAVGDKGTVVELVFFHYSTDYRDRDMQTADGVGRDNSGHYYRIFLSTHSE